MDTLLELYRNNKALLNTIDTDQIDFFIQRLEKKKKSRYSLPQIVRFPFTQHIEFKNCLRTLFVLQLYQVLVIAVS